jgi:hypothetical protein
MLCVESRSNRRPQSLVKMPSRLLTLLLLLLLGPTRLTLATPPDGSPSAAEEFVMTKVRAGENADLSLMQDNELRSDFLENLLIETPLTGNAAKSGIQIRNAIVTGQLNLANSNIIYALTLQDCVFKDGVDFSNALFRQALVLTGCTFCNSAIFSLMKAESRAVFDDTTFHGPVSFDHATFAYDLSMDRTTFSHRYETVWLNFIRVTDNVLMLNATFNAGANFSDGDISKEIVMSGARFTNPDSVADFHRLTVAGDLQLERAMFAGKADFSFVNLRGSLGLSWAQFRNQNVNINFGTANVGGDLRLYSAIFEGKALFKHAKIVGELDLSEVQFYNAQSAADFTGISVSGLANLAWARIAGRVILENAAFQRLDMTHVTWAGSPDSVRVVGMTFDTIAGDSPDEAFGAIRNLVSHIKYNPSIYANLEADFKRNGEPEKADQIFIEGKDREKNEVFWDKNEVFFKQPHFWNWAGSLILGSLVGYGRVPAYALIWSVPFIALGSLVFFRTDNMQPKVPEAGNYKYSPLLYSLDVFAPFIDLKADSMWTPKSNRRWIWFYFVIHRLAGFLLIPIGIAAVTGIVK